MKRLPQPDLDAVEVYGACVGEILSAELSMRFVNVVDKLLALAQEYKVRAVASELHLYPASKWGKGDQMVIGGLTKTQFNDLDVYKRQDSSVLRQCRSRFRMSYGEVPQGISFRAVTDAAVRQTWRNMSLACWCSSSRVGYLRASAMSSAS